MNRFNLSPLRQTIRMRWRSYPRRVVAFDSMGKPIATAPTVFCCLDGVKAHLSAMRTAGGPPTVTTVRAPGGDTCEIKHL